MKPMRSGERKFFPEGLRSYVPGRIALDEVRRQSWKQCDAVARDKGTEIAGRLGVRSDVTEPTPCDYPALGKLEGESTWVATGAQVKAAAWTIYFVFVWDYEWNKDLPYSVAVWIYSMAAGGRKRLDALYAALRKATRRANLDQDDSDGTIILQRRVDASPQGIKRALERAAQDLVGLLAAPGLKRALRVR